MIQKDTLLIGDQVTLSFKTKVPKGGQLFLQELQNPISQGVELVGRPKIDTLSNKGGEMELQTSFTLTSFDSGTHVVPPIAAYLQKLDGSVDTVMFDPGTLEFTTIQIDTTSYRPFDVKDQMTYPYTVKEFLPWFGGLLLLAALIWGAIRVFRRLKAKRSLFMPEREPDPPYIMALRTLEQIRNEKLWQNNQEKLYYTKITDTLREYMESQFFIQAMEKTSAEILAELKGKGIEKSTFESLKELLELSDMVKFAKYRATELENENAVPVAIRFINVTCQPPVQSSGQTQDKSANNESPLINKEV